MQAGPTRDRTLEEYIQFIDQARLDRLDALGERLDDARILHLNSAATGGGVAELLRSLIPLSTDAGVRTDWYVMDGSTTFFETTKTLHNGLQGADVTLTDEMQDSYDSVVDQEAAALAEETDLSAYDLLVVHDPQPLGLLPHLRGAGLDAAVVWRCHIDLTDPDPDAIAFLRPAVDTVDHLIVSRPAFGDALVSAGIDPPQRVIHPSIDPLTTKNRSLTEAETARADAELDGIPLDEAPVVTQVSRFDPWKDPEGVVDVHQRVHESVPEAHLVLAGGMADDDPEAVRVYETVAETAADDPSIHLVQDLSDEAINRLQRGSTVVLQKSLREGFALTVSEALWKETPVVGADVGGIPLQIEDGVNGHLVDPEEYATTAARVRDLLTDPDRAAEMGATGREHVRQQFLLPRQLVDYLALYADLL